MRWIRCILLGALAASGCTGGDRRAEATDPPGVNRGVEPGQTSGEAHTDTQDAATDDEPDPYQTLLAYEQDRRQHTDFAAVPPADAVHGPDPYDLVRLPDRASGPARDRTRFVGLLRGADAVVVLDERARELSRVAAPSSPTGLAVSDRGDIYVSGEHAADIVHYRVTGAGAIERRGAIPIPDAMAVVDLAIGPEGVLYAVEEHTGRLLVVSLARRSVREIGRCHGPTRVVRAQRHVLVNCLLDHTVEIRVVHDRGVPAPAPVATIRHDGPMWSISAHSVDGALIIAAGGVEDHPLDRSDNGFGYIDSFVYVYALDPSTHAITRRAAT